MPRRIGRHIGTGADDPGALRRESLRDALACWATGVSLVAVREGSQVHALTVNAFMPVSFEPPIIAVSLGGNASVRPFLEPGGELAVSILAADQRGLANRFADTFPVGPTPFPAQGPPVAEGALAYLVCRVEETLDRGDHRLVLAQVYDAGGGVGPALTYLRREYGALG